MADFVQMARRVMAGMAHDRSALEMERAPAGLDPSPEELALASAVLTKAGIRLMRVDGLDMVGIWSDLDGPEVRAALRTFGSGQLPVRYLDGDGIPMRYKLHARQDREADPRGTYVTEIYCDNTKCNVRTCTVFAKSFGDNPEPTKWKCPACGRKAKVHWCKPRLDYEIDSFVF